MVKFTKKGLSLILVVFAFNLLMPFLSFVNAADLSSSTILADPTTIHSLQYSTITVTANGTGGLVEGASVGIHVEGGLFPTDTNIYNFTSDVNGEVIVLWQAPLVDEVTDYNFTAIIKFPSSINVTVTEQVTVEPLDYSGTTFIADPSSINEQTSSEISVIVKDDDEILEGANVTLTGVGGIFTSSGKENSSGLSDTNGEYSDFWEAPELADKTNFTIALRIIYDGTIVDYTDELNVTVIPVEGQLKLNISVTPSYNLEVGDVATIEVTVIDDSTSLVVEGVNVTLVSIEGPFVESGLINISKLTGVDGKISVQWDTASLTPVSVSGQEYFIDITAFKLGLTNNYTQITFNVIDPSGELSVEITSNKTEINLGETITITVTVSIDSTLIVDAYIKIEVQSGIFEESGSDNVTGYTDVSGEFSAIWNTTNMVMIGGDPVNYTFTITVGIFPHFLDVQFEYTVTVTPTTTTPTTTTQGGAFYTQWWFYVAAAGGIIVIGVVVVIFTRKKP